MLTIRFFKTGKRNQTFFRIVITEKKNSPQGGRFLEILGSYNPLTKEKVLKSERIKYWLSVGAQTSDTVHNLLVKEGIIKGKKIDVHKKSKKKSEEGKDVSGQEAIKSKNKEEKISTPLPVEASIEKGGATKDSVSSPAKAPLEAEVSKPVNKPIDKPMDKPVGKEEGDKSQKPEKPKKEKNIDK